MKLRYKRVVLVVMIGCLLIGIVSYLFLNRCHYYEYDGTIDTYIGSYQKDQKIYTFDLKGFEVGEKVYLSLNDLYNWVVIEDEDAQVYVDYQKHTMVYQLSDTTYYIDFGRDEIKYNDDCINVEKNNENIYIYHKNIYLSVYFIEKILLKNEKNIKIENKNAIIS